MSATRTSPASAAALAARTRLLPREQLTPDLIQDLYAVDFDHLQRLYERVNSSEEVVGTVTCPTCDAAFEIDLAGLEDGGLGG